MTMRMPSLSDSSRRSEMPSSFLSLTRSAMFSMSLALLTMYGSSVTRMTFLPPSSVISAFALIFMVPLPVR